jgi:hypothetical protein
MGVVALVVGTATPARAAAGADDAAATDRESAEPPAPPVDSAATAGAFLPFTQSAALDHQRAYVTSVGGYDSARATGSFEAAAEVRLWGPLAVRGGAVYTVDGRTLRPSFGARLQILSEGRHGVDGAVGVFYRPEGLTEPEGEIESVVSVGKHVGQTYLLGNLLYGQDPEGNERDGEARLAALRPLGSRFGSRSGLRFLGGVDGRLRFDLGSQAAKLAQHHEATLDALLGPSLTALVGPVALSLHGGGSALRLQQATAYGAFVMFGLGTAL